MQQGPRAADVAPYPEGRRFLRPGESLTAGEALTSVDRKSKAVLQDDGNLVVFTHDAKGVETVSFHTDTRTAVRLTLEGSADLVLYDGAGAPVWSSGSAGKGLGGPGAAAVDDAGALCVTDGTGANVWTSAGSAWAQAKANAASLLEVGRQAAAAAAEKGSTAVAAALAAGKAAVERATAGGGKEEGKEAPAV